MIKDNTKLRFDKQSTYCRQQVSRRCAMATNVESGNAWPRPVLLHGMPNLCIWDFVTKQGFNGFCDFTVFGTGFKVPSPRKIAARDSPTEIIRDGAVWGFMSSGQFQVWKSLKIQGFMMHFHPHPTCSPPILGWQGSKSDSSCCKSRGINHLENP